MATHVTDYPKIGQWNTTHRETDAHAHTRVYTHTHTHNTHAHTYMHRYQLEESEPCQCRVACLRPAFNAATHIFPQNRHVLWTGTTGLRSGQKGRETVPSPPPSHPPWPPAPPPPLNATSHLRQTEKRTKKNFSPDARGSRHVQRLAVASAAPLTIVAGRNTHKHHHAQKKKTFLLTYSKYEMILFFLHAFWS